MYARDTIAALATGAGPAAVAVVRISGADAEAIARRVFRARGAEGWITRKLYVGDVIDSSARLVDRALLAIMRRPASYTGEDVVEIHCHGGVAVARRVLAVVLEGGARAAERGEFTSRAFLNGKLDLVQAESVSDLIAARTDAAARNALQQLDGSLSRAVGAIRERLVALAARVEVAIDFSDEDVAPLDVDALADDGAEIVAELRALADTHARGRLLRDGVRVAIVGRPNVGKSSLLNRLLGVERAIVTEIPGTTRDVIEEAIDIGGVAITLSDTAGLRSSGDPVEAIGIERTRREMETADLLLAVFDGSARWTEEDERVLDAARDRLRLIVLNKDDRPPSREIPAEVRRRAVAVSALTGRGFDKLRYEMLEAIGIRSMEGAGPVITRERHEAALRSAAEAAERAIGAVSAGLSPDVVAVDIMTALDHLGEIVGSTSPEDVLDRIFREFCIGK